MKNTMIETTFRSCRWLLAIAMIAWATACGPQALDESAISADDIAGESELGEGEAELYSLNSPEKKGELQPFGTAKSSISTRTGFHEYAVGIESGQTAIFTVTTSFEPRITLARGSSKWTATSVKTGSKWVSSIKTSVRTTAGYKLLITSKANITAVKAVTKSSPYIVEYSPSINCENDALACGPLGKCIASTGNDFCAPKAACSAPVDCESGDDKACVGSWTCSGATPAAGGTCGRTCTKPDACAALNVTTCSTNTACELTSNGSTGFCSYNGVDGSRQCAFPRMMPVCRTKKAAPAGSVGSTCGGFRAGNAPCATGLFCKIDIAGICGAADAAGTCQPVPTVCTKEYAPVCGCDGTTYANSCLADAAATSVAALGACKGAVGSSCGTRGTQPCSEGLFCKREIAAACGIWDAGGTCQEVPAFCDKALFPVCGCDQQTYNNECEASAAGVSVKSNGACPTGQAEGQTCGTRGTGSCQEGLYCSFSEAAACGTFDAGGVCAKKAEVCTTLYQPVCGCDGQTYGNACSASSAGVSVKSNGACQGSEGTFCGGIAGFQCDAGLTCVAGAGMCRVADGGGTCTQLPSVCPRTTIAAQVCGCNGKTYGNTCLATKAGISVDYAGACRTATP